VPALFTKAARFQSWLDVEAALAEPGITPINGVESAPTPDAAPRRGAAGHLRAEGCHPSEKRIGCRV
jgi:hypothetical protein